MTDYKECYKAQERNTSNRFEAFTSLLKLIFIILCGVFLSAKLSPHVISGLRYALFNVIPAAFPFMIISDIYLRYGYPERIGIIAKTFTKITNLPSASLRAFLIGNIAGFPIGAKLSGEIFKSGIIDKRNCEYLSAISCNPSIPFVLVVIGDTLLKSRKHGVSLLLITYISTILTAILWREKNNKKVEDSYKIQLPPFCLVESVKAAAKSSLYLSAFITFFACISAIVFESQLNPILIALIGGLAEITTATNYIANIDYSYIIKLCLISFSLSFGGASVMLQSASLIQEKHTIGIRYFLIKLTQSLISVLVTVLFFAFLNPLN